MPCPKRKNSKQRRDKRAANKGITMKIGTNCLNCKEPIPQHSICNSCGFYKGKKILTTKLERVLSRSSKKKNIVANNEAKLNLNKAKAMTEEVDLKK